MKRKSKLILFVLLMAMSRAEQPASNQSRNKTRVYLRKSTKFNMKKSIVKASTTVNRKKKESRVMKKEFNSMETWQSLGLNDAANGNVGRSLSLSDDGHTVAVATHYKKEFNFGHVEVFHWDGTAWNQLGNRIEGDPLSTVESVSISGDGTRVAIGEPSFNHFSGRARIFALDGETWTQMGKTIRILGPKVRTGESVALSSDGNVLAVGAPGVSTLSRNGQVRAYRWNASDWRPLGQPIEGKKNHDQYGWSLALSADGHVLATGGYNGANESANAGVYELTDNLWMQMGSEFKAAMTYDSYYINNLSLSSDGKTFALGEPGDHTNSQYGGRARVFHWDNGKWTQLGNDIVAESASAGNPNSGYFGYSVSLSSSGVMLAVGGPTHGSKYNHSGLAVVLKWNGSAWVRIGQDFEGSDKNQYVGWSVALSNDGTTFAVGEPASNSIGHVKVYQIPIAATSACSQGDSNYKTWTGEQFEYHGQCDMMLLKEENFADGLGLQIQTRTKILRSWSFNQAVAIKIGNDILEIEGTTDDQLRKGAENQQSSNIYWINGVYQGPLKTIGGFPVRIQVVPYRRRRRNYIVDLGSVYPGQKIVLSTWNEYVRVDIQNGTLESFGKSVGMLGDFTTGKTVARDGITELLHDDLEYGSEWQVLPSDDGILFHNAIEPQFPNKCIHWRRSGSDSQSNSLRGTIANFQSI